MSEPAHGAGAAQPAALTPAAAGVDEAVDEVAVLGPPPQHDRVDHVAVVAVDHVRVDGVLDGDPQLVVGVGVPAELLDDHAGLDAQPLGSTCCLGGSATHRRAHATPPFVDRPRGRGVGVVHRSWPGDASLSRVLAGALCNWSVDFSPTDDVTRCACE